MASEERRSAESACSTRRSVAMESKGAVAHVFGRVSVLKDGGNHHGRVYLR